MNDLNEARDRAVIARQEKSLELEAEAVAMVKKYGFLLPAPAKDFFRKLAIFLNWQQLMKEL